MSMPVEEFVNTFDLQEDLSLADARVLFDTVPERFPSMESRLGKHSNIVLDPDFENVIVKIQSKNLDGLANSERDYVKYLPAENSETDLSKDSALSLADRALKKRRVTNISTYSDLSYLRPTSSICERFFSNAGYCLTDRRMVTLPSNFESQLFLHVNCDLWRIEDIQELFK